MPIIMGTAGHIDHGKTTLIKALSGIDCDRLKDEKKRGITIELGFAYLDLPDSTKLGIVDVPGHEKFVKNMVAGAAGIDFVLLTVAADEGIMPQTREHMEICSLLGIRDGLVALTKVDTVDDDLLELAQEDVQDFLSGTFLDQAPVFPVSSHTGQGLDPLLQALQGKASQVSAKDSSDIFRLPIDRVFTMRGHGTVITGTVIAGQASLGDTVRVFPGTHTSKVRGLQVHSDSVPTAYAGQRTAMNLSGLEVEDLSRGDTVARPGNLFPSQLWDLELTCLPTAPKPLKHRKEIHFHHGTREILGKIYLLEGDVLEPGQTGLAQVRFAQPMVGVYGDRFVIRSFSPLRTIGGGRVINPLGRRSRRSAVKLDLLRQLTQDDPATIILAQLQLAGPAGLTLAQLQIMVNISSKQLNKIFQDLGGKQKLAIFDREEQRTVSMGIIADLQDKLTRYLRTYHKDNPWQLGVSRGAIITSWGKDLPPKLVHFLLERCLKNGVIVSEKEVLRLPEHSISLGTDQTELKSRLLKTYTEAGIQPPNLNTVLEDLKVSKKEALPVMKLLMEEGKLSKVNDSLYFSSDALARIKSMVLDHFASHDELSPTGFRDLTGLSRKFTIPLLEYLDKEKVTMRIGDVRKLRRG